VVAELALAQEQASVRDRENLLNQSGADEYISKPVVDYQEFLAQIIALLPKD
jgi:DNA-binding response OmpR family regulator